MAPTTATAVRNSSAVPASSARDLMEKLNADASRLNVWVRTEMNAPSQRAWFVDAGGETGAGQMASGRVAANQIKTLPTRWRWQDYGPVLHRISEIASRADVSPIEFADRQSILLTNPGLGGRLQVASTMRCAVSVYNPGDVAPAHVHSANASRTILSDHGGYTNVEGERCDAKRGDLILTPNGTWHDHGNDSDTPVIWIDMLDWPLLEYLDIAWVDLDYQGAGEKSNAKIQRTEHTDGYSSRLYGTGGLTPAFVSHQRGWGHNPTPMIHYRGADVREALDALRSEAGDPYEGITAVRQSGDRQPGLSHHELFGPAVAAGRADQDQTRNLQHFRRRHRRLRHHRGWRPDVRLGTERHHDAAQLPVAAAQEHRQG